MKESEIFHAAAILSAAVVSTQGQYGNGAQRDSEEMQKVAMETFEKLYAELNEKFGGKKD